MTTDFDITGFVAFYPCHDLAATTDFYTRDVGLSLVRDQKTCVIFKVASEAYLGFCQHEGDIPDHKGVIITLLTDEVDEVYRRLLRLNIETEGKPKENGSFGIYHFFARDPDGYRLEVQRFSDPLE